MDPVIEHREVRFRRPTAGAEYKGDLGVIFGNPAHGLFVAKRIPEDNGWLLLLRHFPQDALHIAGITDVICKFVADTAVGLGFLQRAVDDPIPWLFDGRGIGAEYGKYLALFRQGGGWHGWRAGGQEQYQYKHENRQRILHLDPPRLLGYGSLELLDVLILLQSIISDKSI